MEGATRMTSALDARFAFAAVMPRFGQREQGEQEVRRAAVSQVRVKSHQDCGDDHRHKCCDSRHAGGIAASPGRHPARLHHRLHEEKEAREQRDAPAPQQPRVTALDPHIASSLSGDWDAC